MKVYLGADHAGAALKGKVKRWLERHKIQYKDFGTFDNRKSVDYPDFAFKVGEEVAKSRGKDKGILICGSGTGGATG